MRLIVYASVAALAATSIGIAAGVDKTVRGDLKIEAVQATESTDLGMARSVTIDSFVDTVIEPAPAPITAPAMEILKRDILDEPIRVATVGDNGVAGPTAGASADVNGPEADAFTPELPETAARPTPRPTETRRAAPRNRATTRRSAPRQTRTTRTNVSEIAPRRASKSALSYPRAWVIGSFR